MPTCTRERLTQLTRLITIGLTGLWLALETHDLLRSLHAHLHRTRRDDTGSESTEKAVLTAIALGVAVGLGAAITAVVHKYQGQIH